MFDLRDIPIDSKDKDLLETNQYADAISEFIRSSNPPLTISIQGEWGCGKTSLMKMIESNVCDKNKDINYEGIWINTWEFFIKNDSVNAYEQIILQILREVTRRNKNDSQSFKEDIVDLKENLSKYLKNIANISMDIAGVSDETKQGAIDIFSDINITSISRLRKSIEKTISKMITQKNDISNNGFVFFIDDLDRIDPEKAIELLEIFKNLFDIDYCVFILAIDYDVIIRGLHKKYGEYNKNNERAFRAYFDKLIQLPFSMPTKNYDSSNLLMESLEKIKYFNNQDIDNNTYRLMSKFIKLTIQNNPRSFKRVVNSLLLSDIIDKMNKKVLLNVDRRILNFIFVSIQIGYPKIYGFMNSNVDLLSKYYLEGNNEFIDKLSTEFSEDMHITKNIDDIINVFDLAKNVVYDNKELEAILELSSTTNICEDASSEILFSGKDYDSSSQTQYKQGNRLLNSIAIRPDTRILDIGCGNGKTTLELFKRANNIKIDAFDYSHSQIEVANLNRGKEDISGKEVNFYQMDALDLVSKSEYDLIFSNAVLHWILDSKTMYTKIFNALKDDGSIAIHQGGKDSYIGLHDIVWEAISNLNYDKYFKNWKCPLFYPSKSEMEKLLQEIGFKNINIKSEESYGSEYSDLIDNFANATLLSYLNKCSNKLEKVKLEDEYRRLANQDENLNLYSHRLYIYADK